jgi:hypothetical protein
MRIAARKNPNSILSRREQLISEHLRAASLSEVFPDVELLRIELVFNDLDARSPAPSAQLHTLYSAAPAFFRFACPCADCDGEFDLTDAVIPLIAAGAGRKRAAFREGHVSCRGVRFRGHAQHETSCRIQLTFRLHTEPRRAG